MRVRKPSASLVLSCLALFVALGGTSYAVSKLSGSAIKKRSIPGNRIKKNALGGAEIKESKLGKVPSAALADNATNAANATNATNAANAANATNAANAANATNAANAANATNAGHATNADNASLVDGMNATAFRYAAANGDSNTIVLDNFDGLTLRASCTSGSGTSKGLTVQGSSSVPAFISYSSIALGGTGLSGGSAKNDSRGLGATFADLMTPGGTVESGNGSIGIGFATGQIVYMQNGGGNVVTILWNYNNNVDSHDCLFTGTALGHPSATAVGRSASRTPAGTAQQRARAAG